MYLFRLVLLLLSIFLSDVSVAQSADSAAPEISADSSNETDNVIKLYKNKDVTLYNFSPELLKALEDCSAYSEDFTQHNPEIKETVARLFEWANFSLSVNIAGKENELCHFIIEHKIAGIGGQKHDCKITDTQKNDLLEAMKDRSTETITETYISEPAHDGALPVETTITAGRFDVVADKLQNTACTVEETQPTEAEIEEARKKYQQLPEEFVEALSACDEKNISRSVLFFNESINIVGWNGDKCRVLYNAFELNIPQNKLLTIKSYDDLDELCNDSRIAELDYKKNFLYNDLIFDLSRCAEYTKQTDGARLTQQLGKFTLKSGTSSIFKEQTCQITFINEISDDKKSTDYSVVCSVPQADITEILEPYQALIKQYGVQKKYNADGSIKSVSGPISNDETKRADAKIMYELQKRGLCKLKNE